MTDVNPDAALAAALAAFQADMPTIPKGQKARVPTKTGGSYEYTYAGLPAVSEVVMPLLSKHGLSFSVCPRVTDAHAEVVGILLHKDGGRLEASLPMNGRTPQEIGSALTYARRYLLGCMTGVVTDDDDDGSLAEAAKRTVAAPKPMTPKTRGELFALFDQKGITEEQQRKGLGRYMGLDGPVGSRSEATEVAAREFIKWLRGQPDVLAATPDRVES